MPDSARTQAAAGRPLVTLTTDFGDRDYYVAAMKARLIGQCSNVRLIDITHQVPRHDILFGSITLERAIDGFPAGSIHLAVVDPGVGTQRRILVSRLKQHWIVCPDNGLITWAWRRLGPGQAFELRWAPDGGAASTTFHGRDIMAPVAGMLACGRDVSDLAREIDDPVLLDIAPAQSAGDEVRVIHVDHFGNATTNLSIDAMRALRKPQVRVTTCDVGPLRRTYWDVEPGCALALVGSSGLLEIAVRDGSAAQALRLRVGDRVELHESAEA